MSRLAVIFVFILSLVKFASAFSQHILETVFYDEDKIYLKEKYYVLKKNQTVKDSLYISYYHNGKIKSKGMYIRNKANGKWEYFYENGNIKMRGDLKDNDGFGRWFYYYENGGLNMEGEVRKGYKEDEWKLYYENGGIKAVGIFQNSKKEGLWRYYYEDGIFKATGEFKNDEGIYKEVYPSGKVRTEGKITGGKSNGLWKYYYEEGQLKAEGDEKNGLKEGYWKYYYTNGRMASEGYYLHGKEIGKWRYYHEDSEKVSAEGEMKEGQKDGYWKLYYRDGTFKAEGNFKEGDGSYKEYYESGKLKVEGNLIKGKNEGEWNYYYESGGREGKCFFKEGKGHYTGYYENGSLKMEGMIEDGNKVGIWKLYNEDGQLAGYYKTYYENEVPIFLKVEENSKDTSTVEASHITEKKGTVVPKKKSVHFSSKTNEYRSIIFGIQPFGLVRNHFIVSIESYFQERLGYEVGLIYYSKPFFKSFSNPAVNAVYKRGYGGYLRQKLYKKDKDNGMLYWGQELRITSIDYFVVTTDTINGTYQLNAKENLYELSVLAGDRLLKSARGKGWTIDIFGGVGVGYRYITRNYIEDKKKDALFIGLKNRNFSIPLRFGISVGYLF